MAIKIPALRNKAARLFSGSRRHSKARQAVASAAAEIREANRSMEESQARIDVLRTETRANLDKVQEILDSLR